MVSLKKRDFIYGAILSELISSKYKTVLIDGKSKERRIYKFTSNTEEDFIAYFKYSLASKYSERDKSTSWQFNFSEKEMEQILEYVYSDVAIKIFCLCGNKELRGSEIAVIKNDEIESTIFESEKDSNTITIRKEFKTNYYKIPRNGGRDNDLPIATNRIDAH